MSHLQALAMFFGVWIGFFFAVIGLASIAVMFLNKEHLSGGITFFSCLTALGITLVIAILKPI